MACVRLVFLRASIAQYVNISVTCERWRCSQGLNVLFLVQIVVTKCLIVWFNNLYIMNVSQSSRDYVNRFDRG